MDKERSSDHLMKKVKAHLEKSWKIIGLGWLGKSLSEKLQSLGAFVHGTHRTSFDFETDQIPVMPASDLLFLNTPPLLKIKPRDYVAKVVAASFPRAIFISSTSVYGQSGEALSERDLPLPSTASGIWLLEVETRLREELKEKLAVIRPGGLIGGERHPVRSLSGKSGVAGGNHSVNLIHRDDLIEVILAVEKNPQIQLVNAVAPTHPKRDLYYNQWAQKLNLPEISFLSSTEKDRVITSVYLQDLVKDWKCPGLDFI